MCFFFFIFSLLLFNLQEVDGLHGQIGRRVVPIVYRQDDVHVTASVIMIHRRHQLVLVYQRMVLLNGPHAVAEIFKRLNVVAEVVMPEKKV